MQFLIFSLCLDISASLGWITHECMCKIFNKAWANMSSDFTYGFADLLSAVFGRHETVKK